MVLAMPAARTLVAESTDARMDDANAEVYFPVERMLAELHLSASSCEPIAGIGVTAAREKKDLLICLFLYDVVTVM